MDAINFDDATPAPAAHLETARAVFAALAQFEAEATSLRSAACALREITSQPTADGAWDDRAAALDYLAADIAATATLLHERLDNGMADAQAAIRGAAGEAEHAGES